MANDVVLMMIRHRFGRSQGRWLQEITTFLCLMLAFLTVFVCSGCTEEKNPVPPPPRAELKRIVDWLDLHYQTFPPGKGWKVSSVTSQGEQVQITVEIPPDQAGQIKRQPADYQFRLVAGQVCPGKDEAVWRLLPAGNSVKVLPSVSGQVFIEVDCGH
jgi:hypothetical protein